MLLGGAWLALAAVAWCARAGPGPPALLPAEFRLAFTRALYNVSVPENSPPRTYCSSARGEPPPAVRVPAAMRAGAALRFRIRHGDKDKFFKAEERCAGDLCFLLVRTRAGHGDVLNRERRDAYRLDVRATLARADGAALEADAVVRVAVEDENDLSPLFYPTEYDVEVPEDAAPHASVARVSAEDADLGLNGEIYYSFAEPTDLFAVHPTSGVVTLTRALFAAEGAVHRLTVLARDRASLRDRGADAPAARAPLVVRVARVNLHAPEMRARNQPAPPPAPAPQLYAIVEATDRDAGEHGRVASLDIVDGDPDGHFRVRPSARPGEWEVLAHALLARGPVPRPYNLTLRATDAGTPPRSSYLALPVTLAGAEEDAPVFAREVYEASVPETAPPRTPLVRLKVRARDEARDARPHLEIVGGNEGGEFAVNADTGVLYTARELDAERQARYALTVSAVGRGGGGGGPRHQSSAKVKITVLDANDNAPAFESDELRVAVPENGPAGAVVARVAARDADSGDNAYVSYALANLRPVPFEVDPFSGVVRTARPLDYESMRREYELHVRAGDWGAPFRRQAEMRLIVSLQDVNDNRPQFERVECVGHLPRRLPPGAEVATLSAVDFDAGDVVSYRILGGNDDNCFSLDPATGVLSVACDLAYVRDDTRVVNVTATDGTHFADATSLTLHLARSAAGEARALRCRETGAARRLAELLAAAERANAPPEPADEPPPAPARRDDNLHAPEFVDFPVEVKVNESVALGTSLVRLRARDPDPGYAGLVTFGISGGDPDSAFRVDPDTGELQVIGHLDREREAEYFLNVTAWDQGAPRRAASRLLPVTVLDVNDNAPRFERALASFRVTENAINGTVVFRANATDRDAGAFGRVAYALLGDGRGEFCVDARSGALAVCAPLDRERRALYELTVRATDGGGLHADARVRVAVDDVNDNPPRFGLPAYSARVREDAPLGALVAALEAFDPDLGAGGRVTYSLADADADAAFLVDAASGAVRVARALDFEARQVYGVTVRATDGGRPALWAEATLVVELEDVDENAHAPTFGAAGVLAGAVREDAEPGSRVLAAPALDADPPGRDSRLAYYLAAGDGMAHFAVDDSGVVRTLTPLDREAAPHYWLTLCAHDHALVPRHACIEVYIEVEDVNDLAPWPARAAYRAVVAEGAPRGTRLLAVACEDEDAAQPLRYSIVAGNPDGLFSIDENTGELVTTGRALDREAAPAHALEVQCSDGELAGAVRVAVAVDDVNDHAPEFSQRYYRLRVPEPAAPTAIIPPAPLAAGESSTEWDSEDEEEGSGRASWEQAAEPAAGLYLGGVLALDADAGVNGTVRYWARARGSARGLLRVAAASGRLLAAPGAHLRAGDTYELALRACDGGTPPRCGAARAALRVVARGSGGAPRLAPPPPLQVAELDAPGFLLAVLQAVDPDGDALYYDIVDGDPRREFHLGREDGGLVLARRLLWERQAAYSLNVSVSDGLHVVYTPVTVSVVNDCNEGGVAFSQELYTVEVEEGAPPGAALLTLQARVAPPPAAPGPAPSPRLLYGLHEARAPASLPLFRVHELTGALTLQRPLDRASARLHELTVWARDTAPRASRAFARVRVTVRAAAEVAPAWGRRLAEARVPRTAVRGSLVAALRAARPLAGPVRYSLAAGDAGGLFAVDAALGDVTLARALPPSGPREYTLHVRAAAPAPDAPASDTPAPAAPSPPVATLPLHITIVEPDDAPPRFVSSDVVCEVYENEPAGAALATLEARGPSAVWYSLSGGAGRFRLNPAAGLLTTAAPLDHEAQALYNLTVTAVNMGGGSAIARVTVHVLDRNEFPPRLTAASYRGRVSEAAPPGALVSSGESDAPLGTPLVLAAEDADSPANRQRAYEIVEPEAATLFRVDATTGALRTAAALDRERAAEHRFTVRVLDAGSPPLPADSSAAVVVEVLDVNDCPPVFERAAYVVTVLLPTAAGVEAARLTARDPDGAPLKYDLIEGDAAGAFSLSPAGVLLVAREDVRAGEYALRVRASDGRLAATARVSVRVREAAPAGLAFPKAEYRGSVVENSTKPVTVAVLSVLGAALDEHIEFRILNPTEGFEVGRTSGAVRTTGLPLDREQCAAYTLLVEARSGGAGDGGEGRVARTRLHVSVTDVNDNCPVFEGQPYAAGVAAGAEAGVTLLRVHAVDADAGDNGDVRYEMKRGHGELFRVERRTGELLLRQTLDAHTRLYTLVIAAFDGGVPACGATAEVAVRVWAGGTAPSWERAHYALEAPEDTPPGAPLGPPLRALSPLNRQLIYSLLEDADSPSLLEIHFDTAPPGGGTTPCVVAARAALDADGGAGELHAVVRATDGVTGAFADAALSVRVLDVNDCAPEFLHDEYRAAVSEAAAPPHLVLALTATDRDRGVNGEVTYSLAGLRGEPVSEFAIDSRSGEVLVAAPLDAETCAAYHLRVTATDGGRPPLSSTAHLFITVEDVNDVAPRMERGVVAGVVSCEAARGVALARVAAWDGDAGDAPRLRYRLEGAAAATRAFRLHARTGVLSLAGAPPAPPPRALNVSVSDGAHAAFARVKLAPAPCNAAPPSFPHLVQEARARENAPPPLLVTTVQARDPDAGEYGAVTYSIPSALLRDTFAVDARSGAVTTRVPLDREARALWELPVLASDGGGLLAHTTVRVRVDDDNDHAPEFPLREYRCAVRADRAPGAPFLTLAARDRDAGDNARLQYSLFEGTPPAQGAVAALGDAAGLFHVDPDTGALSFARDATLFASRSLAVWVRARDGGGRAAEAPVTVRVLAAGELAPAVRAPPPSLFLREDAAPGALLAELAPPPPETAPRLRLAPARHPPGLFALDADHRLVLAARLDREAVADHDIGVIAESGGIAITMLTRLHVLDVNEHAPVFHSQPYVVHLAENAPPHSSVLRLMADDPDAGSNGEVRYSLAPPEEGAGDGEGEEGAAFAVDPFTGWVTTLRELDREARPEHRLAVLAADGGAPARVARGTLVVRLVDYNDCPPEFERAEYAAGVREDAAPGTVAARLALRDADAAAAPLTFFVADGDARARFQLRASGELFVARELDRELEPAYSLRVAATDGKFTAYTTVRLTVLDVNDNPPYCVRHRYSVRLAEDAAAGAAVAALATGDADSPEHAALRYFLSGELADHFAMGRDTGAVAVAAPARLDREAVPRYRLRMHAQDRARADWECSSELLVELADVNDNAPRFSAPRYSVTLPEDAELGTLVAKVHATDPDLGENRTVRYLWAEGGEAGVFALDAATGVVTLRAALDREAAAEHRAVVRAEDAGRPPRSATAELRLTVADVNDNPPEFEFRSYRAAVSELAAVGAEVLRVRAASRDAGLNAAVAYALVGGDGRVDFALEPTTGALRVARPLDRERRARYLLTAQAVDGGEPPLSDLASLNITVLDANDNAPAFTRAEYAARVREDAPVGARVALLLAEDADAGANGRVAYAIVGGDPDGRFAVDAETGEVRVAAPLDRETRATHALRVEARDGGLPSLAATAALLVEVLDANDNAPAFERAEYEAVVREDRPLGHTVLKFIVTDADAAPNAAPFTFDFQSGNEMGAFRLEEDGYLRSATRFNHRIKARYELRVRVYDNGAPPLYSDAVVRVRVAEQSHYPPVAAALDVLVNSYLDEFPGGPLGRVHASDRDKDDALTFALAPAAPAGPFELAPDTGELRAAPALDVGEYRLDVTVSDGRFETTAPVRVRVVLVTDEELARAAVVRFRAASDADFVLRHRRGFLRAVAEATDREPGDVHLLSVQPAGAGGRLLDVAFAVRGVGADALRRRLHAHVERLEERAQLVVEELVRAACPAACERAACSERLAMLPPPRLVATELASFVAPAHELRAECVTEGGEEGGGAGEEVVRLEGDGYLEYRVERGEGEAEGARLVADELVLSLRFRTRSPRGTLLAVAGRVDYAVLELAAGRLQFRMQLGAGEVALRAAAPAADGRWHEVRLERRGAGVRLALDRRGAHARAPPPAAVLDARAPYRLLVGADLARHQHALAPEQVTNGFDGCISELRLGGAALPLRAGDGSGPVRLERRVRARAAAACPPLAAPGPCGAQPCLHGGTCRALAGGFECACHERYAGARCELDSDPCASAPCLHGGECAADGAGGFVCACAAPLEGARCERGRWCAPGVCLHGGACEEGEDGASCRCRGYYGPRCELDVDECAGEPCLNGATCFNEPGSFRCLCPPDKTGMNCGNPLYSDAVTAGGGASGARALRELWRWALAARWPLAALAAALTLLALLAALPLWLRRRRSPPPPPFADTKPPPRPSKLSNLEAVRRERPTSCAERGRPPPPPLNNADTLRSYGSAGDELEGIPPDYRRNLNLEPADRKPWSEQMHLHTFVDNKIYNDLKGTRAVRRECGRSPATTRRAPPIGAGVGELVGGYHWDCSDWCGGGGLPGISEVAGSERPDSSSGASPPPAAATPRRVRAPRGPRTPRAPRAPALDTDSAPDELDPELLDGDSSCRTDPDASSYLLAGAEPEFSEGEGRRPRLRDPDAASLITMLEERTSLLCGEEGVEGEGGERRSCSPLSARLCEIEDSDAEGDTREDSRGEGNTRGEGLGGPPPYHTDV